MTTAWARSVLHGHGQDIWPLPASIPSPREVGLMVTTRRDICVLGDWWSECPSDGPTRMAMYREGQLLP